MWVQGQAMWTEIYKRLSWPFGSLLAWGVCTRIEPVSGRGSDAPAGIQLEHSDSSAVGGRFFKPHGAPPLLWSPCKLWESIVSPLTVVWAKRLRTSRQAAVLGRNQMATAGLWRGVDDFQWLPRGGRPQRRKEKGVGRPDRKGESQASPWHVHISSSVPHLASSCCESDALGAAPTGTHTQAWPLVGARYPGREHKGCCVFPMWPLSSFIKWCLERGA